MQIDDPTLMIDEEIRKKIVEKGSETKTIDVASILFIYV